MKSKTKLALTGGMTLLVAGVFHEIYQSSDDADQQDSDRQTEVIPDPEGILNAAESAQALETSGEIADIKVSEGVESNNAAGIIEGTDGSGIERTGEVVNTSRLSASEELIDFNMMNPGLEADSAEEPQDLIVVKTPIDWGAARKHDILPVTMLTDTQLDVVEQSRIPVLLPPSEVLLTEGFLTVGDSWYTASLSEENVNVVVEGSNASTEVPVDEQDQGLSTVDSYSVNREAGMLEVVFEAFGVAYSVTVECADQFNMACADDIYISEIVDGLLLANNEGNKDGA